MTDHPSQSALLGELRELADRIPSRPDSTPTVCDVCQDEPALVTIGCVDYCARCAPDPADLVDKAA